MTASCVSGCSDSQARDAPEFDAQESDDGLGHEFRGTLDLDCASSDKCFLGDSFIDAPQFDSLRSDGHSLGDAIISGPRFDLHDLGSPAHDSDHEENLDIL
jgi:hypothetical protein